MTALNQAFQDLATALAYAGTEGGKSGSYSFGVARNIVTLVRTGADALRAKGLTDDQIAAQVPALTSYTIDFLRQKAA